MFAPPTLKIARPTAAVGFFISSQNKALHVWLSNYSPGGFKHLAVHHYWDHCGHTWALKTLERVSYFCPDLCLNTECTTKVYRKFPGLCVLFFCPEIVNRELGSVSGTLYQNQKFCSLSIDVYNLIQMLTLEFWLELSREIIFLLH